MATTTKIARYTELESLRGLMAWLVVSSHVLAQAGYHSRALPPGLGFLRLGGLGVEVFVLLSGFVIFHLLHAREESYGVFLFRRAARLFPAYLLALVAGVTISFFAVPLLDGLPWHDDPTLQVIRANWVASQEYFAPHLALHLSMLHGLLPNEVLPFSSSAFLDVAWSISLEWQFYLLAPLLLWLFRRYTWGPLLFVLGVVVAMRSQRYFGDFFHAGRIATWHLKAFLPLLIQLFALGIGSFYLLRWIGRHQVPMPRFLVLYAGLAAYILPLPGALGIWALVMAALISSQAGSPDLFARALSRLLQSRPLAYLGRISYSTYLFHIPVIYVATLLLLRAGWTTDPARFAALLAVMTVVGTLVVSHFSYRWIERPAMDWASQRFQRPRSFAAVAVAAT